jgi:hypothetical protein
MKKILFVGIVALMVLVCLPGAVFAAPTDTVVVSGSIGGSIDVDVTPDAGVSWGVMTVGTRTDTTTADLNVTTTYNAWRVDAADAKTTNKGLMVDAGTGRFLTNPFQVSNGGAVWTPMTGSLLFQQLSSDGAGTHLYDIGLQQVIAATDEAADNYQITITFTGAAA